MSNLSEICGNCISFDKNGVNKVPIGKIKTEDGEITQGLCRAKPNGLILGVRLDTQKCSMPEGTFLSKEKEIFKTRETNA